MDIEDEDAQNVIIEVTMQNKKEVTKEIKDVTNTTVCNFDSHIFVELMGQSVAQLETTKILIRVLSKGFFKNALIG